MAAMDLFVIPTIGFELLYAFVIVRMPFIVRLHRRDLVWINVTTSPTAEWIACQITEAFPWDEAPRYLIRDRDRIYGAIVTRRMRALGIRDKLNSPASPWQNGFAERLIGSIRRECTDHFIILGEAHLRQSCEPMPTITTASGPTVHRIKMRRSLAQFSGPEASNRTPSLADFITITFGARFSVQTGQGQTGAEHVKSVRATLEASSLTCCTIGGSLCHRAGSAEVLGGRERKRRNR